MQSPALYIAFVAGLLSFLSPCVLPLVPAYIGYLGGAAVPVARGQAVAGQAAAMSRATARWVVMTNALLFVLGFTIVFALIGNLVGVLSEVLAANRRYIEYVAGILLVVFGLHMIGLIRIPFLDYTRRLDVRPQTNLSYLRSFIIVLSFGVGWTPCIGPTLGLIFTMSLNGDAGAAFLPFVAYSIGLGIPFLLAALAMGQISGALKRITRRGISVRLGKWTVIDNTNVVSIVSGLLLVFMGVLVFMNYVTILAPNMTWFNV